MPFAITGARIFDGERMLDGHAVVVDGARIAALVPEDAIPAGIERRAVQGLLAPGFIDCQINGGGGVLFNDAPTVDGIRAIGAAHRLYGTTGFLPTLISDTREKMAEAVSAARAAIGAGVPGVLGIHLEGPFINPEKKGAHDARFIRAIEDEDIRIITSLGAGRTIVTLAPESVPPEAIARLTSAGVIVCAGHTAAAYETVVEAERRGVRGFTHLFNAMPPLSSRAPGPVGAALALPETFAGIIADLHHVAPPVLRAAIRAKGVERTMLVTDAMPTVGTEAESFILQRRDVLRREGRLTTADGTLAGSDLDMAWAVRNAVAHLSVGLAAALRMASAVPAAFLRLDDELGRIAPGYRANLVLLDEDRNVRRTWIDGEEAPAKQE